MVRLNLFKNGVQPAEVEEDDDDEDTQLEEAYERPPIPGSGAMAKFMEKRKEFEKALKAEEARVENEAMALEGTRQDPNGENKKGPKTKRGGIVKPICGFLVMNLMIQPLFCALLACIVGFWMDYVEGNKWGTAFWHIGMRVSSSPPVTNYSPDTALGDTLDTMVGVFANILSCIIYCMSSQLVLVKNSAEGLAPDTWVKAFFVLWVFIPVFYLALCVLLGLLLDFMDGEKVFTGFFYVVSSMTHIANPITDYRPRFFWSRAFCMMIGALSKGLTGVVLGVLFTVVPVMSSIERFNEVFSKLIILEPVREFQEHDIYFGGGHGRRGSFGTVY